MERFFVIAEPDPVISMDLAGILREAVPECHLSVVETMNGAREVTFDDMSKATMIVNATIIQGDDLTFLKSLHALGAQTIFIGEVADTGFEAKSIRMPFTADMIKSALTSDASLPPVRPPEAHT